MSLVLDALRRVEKPDARPGSVGVALASYRPRGRRRSLILPLVLGLATGAVLLVVLEATGRAPARPSPQPPRSSEALPGPAPAMAAAIPSLEPAELEPPPVEPPPANGPVASSSTAAISASTSAARAAPAPGASIPKDVRRGDAAPKASRPPLVLQAISERDSRPIAVISDQLVREGDVLEGVRILSIGPETVDILLETGQKNTLRFLPPPPPALSPSPVSR